MEAAAPTPASSVERVGRCAAAVAETRGVSRVGGWRGEGRGCGGVQRAGRVGGRVGGGVALARTHWRDEASEWANACGGSSVEERERSTRGEERSAGRRRRLCD